MMSLIKRLLADKPLLVLALLYSCAISIMFFVPGKDLPKIQISSLDKIVHVLIFFVFVNIWLAYFYVKHDFAFKNKWIWMLLLSVIVYGIIIEILQERFTLSRNADVFDVIANLIGSLLGIFFFKIVKNKFKV